MDYIYIALFSQRVHVFVFLHTLVKLWCEFCHVLGQIDENDFHICLSSACLQVFSRVAVALSSRALRLGLSFIGEFRPFRLSETFVRQTHFVLFLIHWQCLSQMQHPPLVQI